MEDRYNQNQLRQICQTLASVDEMWENRVAALEEIQELMAEGQFHGERGIYEWNKYIFPKLVIQLKDRRSIVLQAACDTVKCSIEMLEKSNSILESCFYAMCKLLCITIKVISLSAHECLVYIVKNFSIPSLPNVITVLIGKQGILHPHPLWRQRCAEYLCEALQRSSEETLQALQTKTEQAILECVRDSDPIVRNQGRRCFVRLQSINSQRSQALLSLADEAAKRRLLTLPKENKSDTIEACIKPTHKRFSSRKRHQGSKEGLEKENPLSQIPKLGGTAPIRFGEAPSLRKVKKNPKLDTFSLYSDRSASTPTSDAARSGTQSQATFSLEPKNRLLTPQSRLRHKRPVKSHGYSSCDQLPEIKLTPKPLAERKDITTDGNQNTPLRKRPMPMTKKLTPLSLEPLCANLKKKPRRQPERKLSLVVNECPAINTTATPETSFPQKSVFPESQTTAPPSTLSSAQSDPVQHGSANHLLRAKKRRATVQAAEETEVKPRSKRVMTIMEKPTSKKPQPKLSREEQLAIYLKKKEERSARKKLVSKSKETGKINYSRRAHTYDVGRPKHRVSRVSSSAPMSKSESRLPSYPIRKSVSSIQHRPRRMAEASSMDTLPSHQAGFGRKEEAEDEEEKRKRLQMQARSKSRRRQSALLSLDLNRNSDQVSSISRKFNQRYHALDKGVSHHVARNAKSVDQLPTLSSKSSFSQRKVSLTEEKSIADESESKLKENPIKRPQWNGGFSSSMTLMQSNRSRRHRRQTLTSIFDR